MPRFHLTGHKGSWDFRPVRHPITVNGQEVRYLHGRTLFSKDLQVIEAEIPWSMHNNIHDFLITEAGTFVGINQEPVNRDFSDFNDSHGNPYSENEPVHDSVIREFTMAGSVELVWRSWTHRNTLKLSDCQQGNFPSRYAFINSIQFFDDGIVASSRGCNQVIRFERSGAVLSKTTWKLGGSDPGAESDAEYLEIVDDPAGEFCGQHTATLTERDTVMLFDNGVGCSGPRKGKERFTRVIEYDISSGTEARLINEYIPPPEYGVSNSKGSVQDLGGRWLISWGVRSRSRVAANETISVSEIDPEDGRALLHLHMSQDGKTASTARPRSTFRSICRSYIDLGAPLWERTTGRGRIEARVHSFAAGDLQRARHGASQEREWRSSRCDSISPDAPAQGACCLRHSAYRGSSA